MTERGSSGTTISVGRTKWLRFANEAGERWITHQEKPSVELRRLGTHLREMRYGSGVKLADLARDLQMPYERLVMLEQGMLRPSEIPSTAWVRLMRILEGREPLAVTSDEPDPDLLWAERDAAEPLRTPGKQAVGIANIKVIGVGGGGSNAVARMYRQRVIGVEYFAVNTDEQHLRHIDVPRKIRIGDRLTRGLGVGGNPELGKEAAEESREELYQLLDGTDMAFLACGMGGGTGTGAVPVIAEISREVGALTIAVVTKPFSFEGKKRAKQADEGIARLRPHADTLILIPNDRLSALSDERMTAENAFRVADDVLRQGVQSIAELVTVPGEINLDFADVKAIMQGAGPAWMAIGTARGDDRAVAAAKAALASPLLDAPLEGASRVLLNIAGGLDLTMQEVRNAADFIAKIVDPEANIIFGMVTDPKMDDEVRITVIATGLPSAVGDEMVGTTLEEMIGGSLSPDTTAAAAPSEPPVELPGFLRRFGLGRRREGG